MKRAVLLLALAACVDAAPAVREAPLATQTSAIQSGAEDASSSFAVAIFDEDENICSGVLIAPNLVLTARHCVAEGGGDPIDCTIDRFDAPREAKTFHVTTDATARADEAPYAVSKVLVPTTQLFCGNDIALLVLDKNVPAAVAIPATPAIDPPLTDRTKYGTKVTAIGYGTTGPSAWDDGTRRRRDDIPFACIPGDKQLGCTPADYEITDTELAAGDGLCSGDSGSGAFVPSSLASGGPIVVGVLSRAAEYQGKCVDAVYSRTDSFGPFLIEGAKEAATAGGYAVPSWAAPQTAEPTDASVAPPPPPVDGGVSSEAGTPAAAPSDDDGGCTITPGQRPQNSAIWAAIAAIGLVVGWHRRRRTVS